MRIKNNEIISISALISACSCGASVDIFINGESTGVIHINESGGFYKHMLYGTRKKPRTELTLRIKAASGSVILDTIYFE